MKFGKAVVKSRIAILIVAIVLLIPSVLGMIFTRVNYDMLNYLPDSLDTIKGQDYLLEDFDKGAFSFLIFEGMNEKDIVRTEEKIKEIDHIVTVLWYDDIADMSIPMEVLPDKIYDAFNSNNSTLMAVFFDTSSSADETMDAITQIRAVAGEQCFVSGISAMITDLRDLCEEQEAIYVAIAVILAVVAMMIFMDNWIIPFVFLASIGMAILMNLGSNYFLGEISYITKALSAILQLAVTMDYSIFLWHSYGDAWHKRMNWHRRGLLPHHAGHHGRGPRQGVHAGLHGTRLRHRFLRPVAGDQLLRDGPNRLRRYHRHRIFAGKIRIVKTSG